MAEIKFTDSVGIVNKIAPMTYSFKDWHDGGKCVAVLEYHSTSDTVTMQIDDDSEIYFDPTTLAILMDFVKRLTE